jgi:Ubiquitin-2 like Rad60 SUMO-like
VKRSCCGTVDVLVSSKAHLTFVLFALEWRCKITDMPSCDEGENLRLICMGKGFLTPDTRTLEDFQIPIFKTHPTPINVSIKPGASKTKHHDTVDKNKKGESVRAGVAPAAGQATVQGCGCVIS